MSGLEGATGGRDGLVLEGGLPGGEPTCFSLDHQLVLVVGVSGRGSSTVLRPGDEDPEPG